MKRTYTGVPTAQLVADKTTQLVDGGQHGADSAAKDDHTRIVFDLETTGLARAMHEIVEIACWVVGDLPSGYESKYQERPDVFCSLIMPTKPASKRAVEVNGIKKTGKNQMMVRGKLRYNARSAHEVFSELITWLRGFKNPVLIAHNGFRFDAPWLVESLKNENLYTEFEKTVAFFGDTLPELKDVVASKPLSLAVLGKQFIPEWAAFQVHAHSALFDVWATIKVRVFSRILPEFFKKRKAPNIKL